MDLSMRRTENGGGAESGSPDAGQEHFIPTAGRSGEETVFRYPAGNMIFGEDGSLARIECRDLSGAPRTVLFEAYTLTPGP